MNTRKKFFVTGLLAVSLLGVGAAAAFVTTGASVIDGLTGTVDKMIYLDWNTAANTNIADISNLAYGTPIYREISVNAPTQMANDSVAAKLQIVLTPDDGKVLDGVTCSIASHEWGNWGGENYLLGTATSDQNGAFKSAAITAATTFYLKFEVSEEEYALYTAATPTKTMGGNAVISYIAEEVQA